MHTKEPPKYDAIAWRAWIETPLGAYWAQREQLFYQKQLSPQARGTLLRWALPGGNSVQAPQGIKHTYVCAIGGDPFEDKVNIVVDPCYIPLPNASVDLLLMPHVLDYTAHPLLALQEAARVLAPEGRMLITGFNPVSLWGLRRNVDHLLGQGAEPWAGAWLPLEQIKKWCLDTSLHLRGGQFMVYNWPLNYKKALQYGRWLDAAGDRWFPSFAAVYGLVLTKRMAQFTPVSQGFPTTVVYAKSA